MITAVLGIVCDFGVRAKHTPFVHIFCLRKNISRTKFQRLIFFECLLEVQIMLFIFEAYWFPSRRQRITRKQTGPCGVKLLGSNPPCVAGGPPLQPQKAATDGLNLARA